MATSTGTFRAAGCGLFRTVGTAHACGDGIPVPARVDGTHRRQSVPDGVECPRQRAGPQSSTTGTQARPTHPPARDPYLHSEAGSTTSGASPGARTSVQGLCTPWYDPSMTQKIAVSLPDEQVISIRRAVEQGRAPSVSGFISAAVARVQREDDLAQLLDDLDRELGPVDDADLAWADKALGLA